MTRTTVVSVRGLKVLPPGVVYVGRRMFRHPCEEVREGSPWGNPFKPRTGIACFVALAECLARYRAHVLASPALVALLPSLRGKALGCWCCNDPRTGPRDPALYVCHAQVLADLVDESEGAA